MPLAHLPDAIVAASTALATALSSWASEHPDSTLADAERAVLATVRQQLPALLQGVLQTTQRALSSSPLRCPRCRQAALVRDWRPRQVRTLCGRLCWERPWASCGRCGQGFGAGDAALGLAPYQQRSAGLDALLVQLGSMTAFREAAAVLAATTGLQVSAETIRSVTECAGTQLAARQTLAADVVERTGAAASALDAAPAQLLTETDGVMVRYQSGWHELKLALVGGWAATPGRPERPRLAAVSYVAKRADPATFARYWGAEAARRGALEVVGWQGTHNGVARLRQIVILGDGAKWIWETAALLFGERVEIVDYFHACEHLTAVAEALYGPQTTAAQAWAALQRRTLLEHGVDAVLAQLASPGDRDAQALATLRRERGYFTTNQTRMQYPTFQAQGLPIGSGAIESSAKHLIQLRLKRPGCRWSDAGGEALAALRAERATHLSQAA
jgi:Uncharacterised protein family (UPF0236)